MNSYLSMPRQQHPCQILPKRQQQITWSGQESVRRNLQCWNSLSAACNSVESADYTGLLQGVCVSDGGIGPRYQYNQSSCSQFLGLTSGTPFHNTDGPWNTRMVDYLLKTLALCAWAFLTDNAHDPRNNDTDGLSCTFIDDPMTLSPEYGQRRRGSGKGPHPTSTTSYPSNSHSHASPKHYSASSTFPGNRQFRDI